MAGERYDPAIPIRRQGSGFAVEGRGYYLWDDDPKSLLVAAREIERGNTAIRPTKRMLIILRDDFVRGDPEGLDD